MQEASYCLELIDGCSIAFGSAQRTKSQQPVYSQRPAFRLVENNDRPIFLFPTRRTYRIVGLDERLAKGTNLCCKIIWWSGWLGQLRWKWRRGYLAPHYKSCSLPCLGLKSGLGTIWMYKRRGDRLQSLSVMWHLGVKRMWALHRIFFHTCRNMLALYLAMKTTSSK